MSGTHGSDTTDDSNASNSACSYDGPYSGQTTHHA